MTRIILIALVAVLLSHGDFVTYERSACAQDKCKPCFRPNSDPNKMVQNKWPDVTDLVLDQSELRNPLPKGSPPKWPEPWPDTTVRVQTTAADPEGDVLTYNYKVTGGRVVGTGANVFWNLSGVMPGTYTITGGVDDGCGICGETITRTVTVLAHEDTPACVCSDIRIDSLSAKTRIPHLSAFSAYLSGPHRPNLTYNWTISEGTIESGQGTPTIKISHPKEKSGQQLKVSVEVAGLDPNCECPNTALREFKY
jgi:hypothetical protein